MIINIDVLDDTLVLFSCAVFHQCLLKFTLNLFFIFFPFFLLRCDIKRCGWGFFRIFIILKKILRNNLIVDVFFNASLTFCHNYYLSCEHTDQIVTLKVRYIVSRRYLNASYSLMLVFATEEVNCCSRG